VNLSPAATSSSSRVHFLTHSNQERNKTQTCKMSVTGKRKFDTMSFFRSGGKTRKKDEMDGERDGERFDNRSPQQKTAGNCGELRVCIVSRNSFLSLEVTSLFEIQQLYREEGSFQQMHTPENTNSKRERGKREKLANYIHR